MIRLNNDYSRGAHPSILETLSAINEEAYAGYGLDEWCERAQSAILSLAQAPHAAVHFMVGGTQANFTVISAALRPYESILCAESGHINVHETGAVEHGGHKVVGLPATNGKISAEQVEREACDYEQSTVPEHITTPRMVYISQTTEFGTLYSLAELEAISRVCREHGLLLFVDGARMAYALGAPDNDVTLADLARLTDAFTVGGTKCGALFGEAVVLVNPELNVHFRSCIKQNGGMLAKGWLLGVQFCALMEEGLYVELGRKAVCAALRVKRACEDAGIPFFIDSPTNQQFVIVSDAALQVLSEKYAFDYEFRMDESHSCVRICTSWATTEAEVDELVADIERMAREGAFA